MSIIEALLLLQTIVIALASLAIGWQIYQLRLRFQAATCQDIVQKFDHIVENPDFLSIFSFGPEGNEMSEKDKKAATFCSTILAFLEQIYVQSSDGQLAERLNGPWVEFVSYWLNQEPVKKYWGSPSMICPKSGFDSGFRDFVDMTYAGE